MDVTTANDAGAQASWIFGPQAPVSTGAGATDAGASTDFMALVAALMSGTGAEGGLDPSIEDGKSTEADGDESEDINQTLVVPVSTPQTPVTLLGPVDLQALLRVEPAAPEAEGEEAAVEVRASGVEVRTSFGSAVEEPIPTVTDRVVRGASSKGPVELQAPIAFAVQLDSAEITSPEATEAPLPEHENGLPEKTESVEPAMVAHGRAEQPTTPSTQQTIRGEKAPEAARISVEAKADGLVISGETTQITPPEPVKAETRTAPAMHTQPTPPIVKPDPPKSTTEPMPAGTKQTFNEVQTPQPDAVKRVESVEQTQPAAVRRGQSERGQAERPTAEAPTPAPTAPSTSASPDFPTFNGAMTPVAAPRPASAVERTEPVTAAVSLQPERPAGPQSPLRQIEVRLPDVDGASVSLHVTERAGVVRVDVRTPDPVLTDTLRANLDDLTSKLEAQGYHPSMWKPSGEVTGIHGTDSSESTLNQGKPDSGGNAQSQNGTSRNVETDDDRDRQQRRAARAWADYFDNQLNDQTVTDRRF